MPKTFTATSVWETIEEHIAREVPPMSDARREAVDAMFRAVVLIPTGILFILLHVTIRNPEPIEEWEKFAGSLMVAFIWFFGNWVLGKAQKSAVWTVPVGALRRLMIRLWWAITFQKHKGRRHSVQKTTWRGRVDIVWDPEMPGLRWAPIDEPELIERVEILKSQKAHWAPTRGWDPDEHPAYSEAMATSVRPPPKSGELLFKRGRTAFDLSRSPSPTATVSLAIRDPSLRTDGAQLVLELHDPFVFEAPDADRGLPRLERAGMLLDSDAVQADFLPLIVESADIAGIEVPDHLRRLSQAVTPPQL